MASWRDMLSDEHQRVFAYLVVEGIPYVFASCADNGWAAPRCARHTTSIPAYTVLWDTLLTREGLQAPHWRFDQNAGVLDPGPMRLTLVDTDQNNLRELFATRLTSANRTRATDTLEHDTAAGAVAGDRYKLEVEDASNFAASGLIYSGRETCYYTAKGATRFGSDPESDSTFFRGCYAWRWDDADEEQSWWLAYRHYWDEGDSYVAEEWADHPWNWVGRRVSLRVNWFDRQGSGAIDDEFRDDHEVCAYDGFIQRLYWKDGKLILELRSQISALARSIGDHAARAYVGWPPSENPMIYVQPNERGWPIRYGATMDDGSTTTVVGPNYLALRDDAGTPAIVEDAWLPVSTAMRYVAKTLTDHLQSSGSPWTNWPDYTTTFAGLRDGVFVFEIEWGAAPSGYTCYLTLHLDGLFGGMPLLSHSDDDDASSGWGDNTDDRGLYSKHFGQVSDPLNPIDAYWAFSDLLMRSMYNKIPIRYSGDSLQYNRDFHDGECYVVASDDEIIEITGIDASTDAEGYHVLTVADGGRQALGSETADLVPDAYGAYGDGQITVTQGLGFSATSIWEIFLYVMTSTGGDDRHNAWDVGHVGFGWGARICPSQIDYATFEAMGEYEADLGERTFALKDPIDLKSWMADEAKFAQCVIAQRICDDGEQRIGVYPIGQPAAQSEALYGLENGTAITSARHRLDAIKPINFIEINTAWHAGAQEYRGEPIRIPHVEANFQAGQPNKLTLSAPGIQWPWDDAVGPALTIASRILANWLNPGQLIECDTSLDALILIPGQTVAVTTAAGLNTDEGTVDYSARAATVMGVKASFFSPGEKPRATVTLRADPLQQTSTYCPCAKIASVASTTLTLEANEFSSAGSPNPWGERPTVDSVWFQADYEIIVWEHGDWANRITRSVVSRSGNDIVINSALTGGLGAGDYITYAEYTDASLDSEQQRWTYVAGGATPVLDASDDPFTFA